MKKNTKEMSLNTVKILNIKITSTFLAEVLEKILKIEASLRLEEKLVIFTPNPEFLVLASRDLSFREVLNKADINLPDGIGFKLLGFPIKERISGADLVKKLLKIGNEKKWQVGVVGARRGVVREKEEQLRRLSARYPGIDFIDLSDKEKPNSQKIINLIFACQGMGIQERWILENKDRINGKVFVGIGGSLDFLTGFSQRSPVWMQQIGLEWLWRGLQRPSHFKRIWRAVFVFPWLVLREKF